MPTTKITINTGFDGTGAGAAQVALGKVGATASKAERDLAAYARTVAQTQRAQGNTAGTIKTYESALSHLNRTSKEAIAIERQLATVRKAGLGPALPRTLESFGTQAIDQLKTGLIGIVGPAAVATAALKAIPAAIDLAQLGAQADLVRTRFDSLAKSSGIAGDELLAALRKSSGGEISNLNLQLAANKAQLLGVAHSAEEFGVLMAIARDRAQQLGISTTDAFDNIVTGLGRGSRLILDNIGLIVNQDDANKAYARTLGKTVAQLTVQEQKQALINQVIKDGQTTLAATGGAVESAAAAQSRLQASTDNVKASFGSLLANATAPLVNSLSDLINASDGSKEGFNALINGAMIFSQQIVGLPALTAEQEKAQRGWTSAVQDWIIAREIQLGLMAAQPATSGGGGTFEFADVALAREIAEAQLGYASAIEMTGMKQRAAAQAAEQKSAADKVAAIDAQTHGIAEQKLADQAKAAADALIKAGPAGARTAALLAGSSSQIDVLTAAYYRLAAAQDSVDESAAAAAQEKLNGIVKLRASEGIGSGRGGGSDAQAESAAFVGVLKTQNDEAKKAADEAERLAEKAAADAARLADAQFDNQLKLAKTNAAKIALLRQQQAKTSDPVEKARIEGQIIDLQSQKVAGLSKEKNLQESIYDSINKQRDALLDIEELTIKDRQADRDAAAKNKTAQAIINATEGRTDQRSLDFRARAQDVIALNSVEDRQRAAAIAEKQTTAGGAIVNGKLLQSVPGGGAVPAAGAASPVNAPQAAVSAPGGGAYTINLVVDGKTLASVSEPYIMDSLMKAVNTAKARAGA